MALFLVTGEYVEPGPLLPPQQVAQMIENAILPSFDALDKLLGEKKILAGGIATGARSGMFIAEAASHADLSRMLMELPFWGIVQWRVTPLDSFRERRSGESKALDRLKAQK